MTQIITTQKAQEIRAALAAAPTYELPEKMLKESLLQDLGRIEQGHSALPGLPGDPVLRYICTPSPTSEVRQDQWQRAAQALADHYDRYMAVLGSMMPVDLRDAVEWHLASKAYDSGTNTSAAADWPVFMDRLLAESETPFSRGIPTGLASVDSALSGGLRGLTFLAGDRSVGKTSFALNTIRNALVVDEGLCVAWFALDESRHALYRRMIGQAANLPVASLSEASNAERIREVSANLHDRYLHRFKIVERRRGLTTGGLNIHTMMNSIKDLREQYHPERFALVVDMYQRMDTPPMRDDEQDEFRLDVLREVRQMVRTTSQHEGATVIAISEIRKGAGGRRTVGREDLLGSSRILSDADNLLILSPDMEAQGHGDIVPMTLEIDKARNGGRCGKVPLSFNIGTTRFSDVKPEGRPAAASNAGVAANAAANPMAGWQD